MVFPTLQFVLFFATVLLLNGLLWRRNSWRKAMLIAASYTFYAAWDVRFLLLMAWVSTIAWVAGLSARGVNRKATLIVSIVLLIGTLAVFKYFNFFALSLAQLFEGTAFARDLSWISIILPVGVSFYIFQAVSYVVDVARGDVEARKNPTDVFLYISFFPQLVAGPIVRAAHFLPQIDAPQAPDSGARALAVILILMGLFKKMVVANYLAVLLVDPAFDLPEGQNVFTAAVATLGYAIQIYCDFSGYSDIAIGIALLLGYQFLPNFNQPYRAASLREFWQRWHISLSTWIRDYLYIPLGGRSGGVLALLATMTLAGLWHGAAWAFLAWGILHGAGLAIERNFRARERSLPKPVATVLTFTLVCLLWIPFRSVDWQTTMAMLSAFTTVDGFAPISISATVAVLIFVGLAMNWLPLGWMDRCQSLIARLPSPAQAIILAVGTWTCFAAAQEGVAPFIYFQF